MRIRDSKLIRGLRKPSVPREGEISPFWRVISFQRSMRINHGLERLIIPGRGGGREDLLWWKWMVQGRCFTQREEEEEEEAGYNLIPRRMRFGLDFFDIISASTNRLLSQVKLYIEFIYQHGMDPMISLFLYQVNIVFYTLSDLFLLLLLFSSLFSSNFFQQLIQLLSFLFVSNTFLYNF